MKYIVKSKYLLRDLIYQLFWKLGFTKPSSYARGKLAVITFHRVLTEEQRRHYPLPNLAVTPEELDWLCSAFKKYFECGPFTTMYNRWLSDEKSKKPFLAITFDDGQLDNFIQAKPILAKHKLCATFYVPVQFINTQTSIWHDRLGFSVMACVASDVKKAQLISICKTHLDEEMVTKNLVKNIIRRTKYIHPLKRERLVLEVEKLANSTIPKWSRMMSWVQIKELHDAGHEIGSHTMSHALLPQLDDDTLSYEVNESRKVIEQQLGTSIDSFCYPNGDMDDRVQHVVSSAGYKNAVTTQWGLNCSSTEKYVIKRFDIDAFQLLSNNNLSDSHLHFRLSGMHPSLR